MPNIRGYMKFSIFILLLLILSLSCTQYGTSSDKPEINLIAKDSINIPSNAVGIIDFNRVFIKSGNILKLIDMKDPNEFKTIFEVIISDGDNYNSFLNDRFVIFDNRQGVYSQTIIDIITGEMLELKNDNYSTAIKSINPKNNSILYTNQIYHTDLRGLLNKLYLTTFDGQVKLLSDSIGWAKWSPDGNWILFSKFCYKDGNYWKRNTKMMNLSGKEIQLFDESISTLPPIFTNDGSKAFFRLNQGSGAIVVVEFNWIEKQPVIKQTTFGEKYYDPTFWSPDGQYFIHTYEHTDGHVLFGTDIILTNKDLSISIPIISHKNVIEFPVTWTTEYGLITSKHGQLVCYDIVY